MKTSKVCYTVKDAEDIQRVWSMDVDCYNKHTNGKIAVGYVYNDSSKMVVGIGNNVSIISKMEANLLLWELHNALTYNVS